MLHTYSVDISTGYLRLKLHLSVSNGSVLTVIKISASVNKEINESLFSCHHQFLLREVVFPY